LSKTNSTKYGIINDDDDVTDDDDDDVGQYDDDLLDLLGLPMLEKHKTCGLRRPHVFPT
jgi:hypothetical protein